MKRDYYEVLGVARAADGDEIKKSYRRLAMKHHPDRNADDKKAANRFKEIQEAYAVLSDSQKRAAYDRFGHAAAGRGAGGGEAADFSSAFDDIFGQFFGGAGGPAAGRARPQARAARVDLTLEEAAFGCKKKIRINAEARCDDCNGDGAAPGSRPVRCRDCDGAGMRRVSRGIFVMQQTCPRCRGRGTTIDTPCRKCGGRGVATKKTVVSASIPAGIDDGDIFRMHGDFGELHLRARVLPHALFEREGADLHLEIPVSIVTAALGGEIEAPTLAGGRAKLKIPAGAQSGGVLRLRGKGHDDFARQRLGGRYAVPFANRNAGRSERRAARFVAPFRRDDERKSKALAQSRRLVGAGAADFSGGKRQKPVAEEGFEPPTRGL